ncbi:zinc transport system substrate-binding protein [Asanoa ferruginea]|uniref:Zinc transport system substrate-binding protein n=1 Tax=Asanoa ferruginea TaxID=53367 RepID=A0A3D9Z9Z5_9ACTN|nr:metal ABC transporter substrate-binding protein [Asanoa ferruginea]REF94238.1 zinc transport system substrate-binding protein [Asanoa ferruginea]GIF49813.1 zinc ABC transporter substrate-binding protein [Asanoa ferruginea]
MRRRRTVSAVIAGLAAVAATGLAACTTGSAAAAGKVDVVAAFYPLQFVSQQVGGDHVAVTNLAKPGAEPHDLELSARQVGRVSDAKVIVYLKGFQPAMDDAVDQVGGDRAFDVSSAVPLLSAGASDHVHEGETDHDGGSTDPHVWLDPTRLATIGQQVATRLAAADPEHAADYTANADRLRTELTGLDQQYAAGLQNCQRRELVTGHAAFGYLADRYHLEQVGLTGVTPDTEPAPQRLAAVAQEARTHGATTIFFETLVSPKVADTIAQEVGAKTAVLDPIEGLQPGSTGDYFSIMRDNLTTIRTALDCT